MATIKPSSEISVSQNDYYLVRRAQAVIAAYLNFGNGDLSKYLDRASFNTIAEKLTTQYFYKSSALVQALVMQVYLALLVLAPVLQRQPMSCKFDWHAGHILSFIRRNTSSKVGRVHAAVRADDRSYQPDKLAASLEAVGVRDNDMVAVVLDLYRRHSGGTALKDCLAHQLFDPLIMLPERQGFELRYGNQFLRLERSPFDGSIDLRKESLDFLGFSLRSVKHHGGQHLEIKIADLCIAAFHEHIKRINAAAADPDYKIAAITSRIEDFVQHAKFARTGLHQIKQQKEWLANQMQNLARVNPNAKVLPNLLINRWLDVVDSGLYFKQPSFFWDAHAIDEKAYVKFFSPYREVLP